MVNNHLQAAMVKNNLLPLAEMASPHLAEVVLRLQP
jgi:hypothetical protein